MRSIATTGNAGPPHITMFCFRLVTKMPREYKRNPKGKPCRMVSEEVYEKAIKEVQNAISPRVLNINIVTVNNNNYYK